MNKVIFLDFDGVIRVDVSEGGWGMGCTDFCATSIGLVEKVVEATGAQVVISSDWRLSHNRKEICKLIGPVLAAALHNDWKTMDGGERWEEVAAWLDEHPETGFVILDDLKELFLGAGNAIMSRLLICSNRHGVVPSIASKAIDLLNQ